MTKKEKITFAQGVEEGFVRAAELSSEPQRILRRFRRVKPIFEKRAAAQRNGKAAR